MEIVIDTHALIWYLTADKKLNRILVATAIIHKASIISRDPEILSMKEVETIW